MQVSESTWQEALSNLIVDPKELIELLELDFSLLNPAYQAAKIFPLKITRSFAARMQKGNVNDPLLMQVLPLGVELNEVPGYSSDPLKESAANPVPGLLHKYAGRVLVTLTSACAIHCRYCFRREFPYEDNNPGKIGLEKIADYIAQDPSITEVILSGGDPLAVNDKLLLFFSSLLEKIPHVKRLRIHTRLPIVLPQRITQDFINWLQQLKLNTVLVVHANHAQEINDEVRAALQLLKSSGVTLLNQSVLLKGINTDPDTLIELSEALFDAGVLPYYLHALDKVSGSAHFDIDLKDAFDLHAALTKKLPGYLVPKLVREEPGMPSKTILSTELFTR